MIIVFFMRSFVRQQENWALSLREDVLEGLSEKVKGYLGFRCVGTMVSSIDVMRSEAYTSDT